MACLRIVVLLTDGFGGFGGIAKFNRDFLRALDASALVECVTALPRVMPDAIDAPLPEFLIYDRMAARGGLSFARRVLAAARSGRTDVVICGHLHLLPFAWLVAKVRRAKLFLIAHGIEAWKPSNHATANALCRSVDGVLSVSRLTAERFLAWSRVSPSKVRVLPNCVDLDVFKPGPSDPVLLRRYGLLGAKVLLTVGRLEASERYKGVDKIIEALPDLSRVFDVRYLVVGDGSDRPRLERLAEHLGVSERVVFAGKIPEPEKVAHYNIADAYVMPSTGEGFGIVLIEAAGCGVPVIGSAVDGSREALRDGALGRLVDPSSRTELVEAITDVLKNPRGRERIRGVEVFGIPAFQAGVHEWLGTAAKDN